MTGDNLVDAIQLVDDKVDGLALRISKIEATSGKIVLSPALAALMWGIALAVAGAACSTAVAAYQASEAVNEVRVLAVELHQHTAMPWHEAAGHRYDELDRRMDRIENRQVEK